MPADFIFFIGNFDPKAMNNFYDNIEPGPVVPPKPPKKGEQQNVTNITEMHVKTILEFI